MRALLCAAMAAGAFLCSSPADAQATYGRTAVESYAYVTIDDIDWAWVGVSNETVPNGYYTPLDFSYQGLLGWRPPTADEFLNHPVLADFTFDGAGGGWIAYSGLYGVPSGDMACATGWFSGYDFCNWDQAVQDHWFDASKPAGDQYFYQLLVVRPHGFVPAGPIPEPAAWAMLIGGFGMVGGAMRVRTRKVAFA